MRKPDDSTLTPDQYARVRAEAERVLRDAGGIGRFPTPIDDIMAAAKVHEVKENVLDEGFVAKLRRQASGALKSALSKVIGLFDARERLVFIDRTLHVVKQTFIRLHETAHGFMGWQRDLYAIVEDCEQTIDPQLADQFDREANVFAAEVLFQLDGFAQEAEQQDFNILTPVRLSSRYGASIYAAVRQYVIKNWRACAVVVLDPPLLVEGDGFRAAFRRQCFSPAFAELFGNIAWPDVVTPDHLLGSFVPLGKRKMSGKRRIILTDRNGDDQVCIAESFTQSHQVFVLIYATKTLKPRIFLMPSAAKSSAAIGNF